MYNNSQNIVVAKKEYNYFSIKDFTRKCVVVIYIYFDRIVRKKLIVFLREKIRKLSNDLVKICFSLYIFQVR